MRTRVLLFLVSLGALALVALRLVDARPARDLGAWRIVVLQSDDWGMEGWFPSPEAASNLADLVSSIPPRLRPYTRSGLETSEDVQRLAARLAARHDADGLPAVLQANHVVAGPSLRRWPDPDDPLGWPVHPSGEGNGHYRRPELRAAVDDAIGDGVWWPEMHALTHYDLDAYGRARETLQPTATRALREGVYAHDGFLRATELAGRDAGRARVIARETARRFEDRFGRRPDSVIAPDYRWGREDEDAWHEQGLSVVQAKREQVDGSLRPGTQLGRALKWLARWRDRQGGRFTYLDRPARLEPYGETDTGGPQAAQEAAAEVRAAWARGEPGILSVHRVQFSSFDPEVSEAGRAQLDACLDLLESDGPVRYLVDIEVHQLLERGWSRLERGPWVVVRNYTGRAVRAADESGRLRWFDPGTFVLARTVRAAAR